MELEIDFSEVIGKLDKMRDLNFVQVAMIKVGIEAEAIAKQIIDTYVGSDGYSQGVDTGAFRDGVHSDPIEFGFALRDSVPYGIWHEIGTEEHWVPFFDEMGSLTSLGQWAMRHFSSTNESSLKVKGKRGKDLKNPSRVSREEQLKQMGGITVSLDEMAPFRTALEMVKEKAPAIFKEEYEKWLRQG